MTKSDKETDQKDMDEKSNEKTDKASEPETEQQEQREEKEVKEVKDDKKKELTKDDIISILKTFPGIGQVIAERIYNAGFDSRENLEKITVDDLKKIRGIGLSMAQNIESGLKQAIKKFDEPDKAGESASKKDEPGITDKAMGFIKGTISKITGFIKGKMPKGKTEEQKPTPEEKSIKPADESKPKEDREITTEGSGDNDLYPEVGAPESGTEPEKPVEPVTVESSDNDSEPSLKILDQSDKHEGQEPESPEKSETKIITKPEPEPEKINLKDPSGLFKWFESMQNLHPDAGKLIFKAGYNNLEELKDAVVDDLVLIKGIDRNEAQIICDELKKL